VSQEIRKRPEDEDRVSIAASAAWSGPLPPPSALKAYEDTLPGAAERIFSNSEAEAEHRRALEREASRRDSFRSYVGMLAGCCVAILIILIAWVAIREGHSWPGATILTGGLAAVVSVFVTGRRSANDDK
jgi:uncharacterized membrane protein